jgi:hypothetical protein
MVYTTMAKTTLTFPRKSWGRYFEDYVKNIEYIFKAANYPIKYSNKLTHMRTPYGPACAIFNIEINGKPALIDLSDHSNEYCYKMVCNKKVELGKMYEYKDYDMPIFKKMHPDITYTDNVYPYGPLMLISSLREYKDLINYKPDFNKIPTLGISHTNRIYGGAKLTRKVAFSYLHSEKLDNRVSFESSRLPRGQHYGRLRNCAGSLEVGAFSGAQGSGAIEAFLNGIPVISDNMDMILPYNKKISKNEHYIFIEDGYSNINEAINYVYTNRKESVEIAKRVHNLFLETWHPAKLVEWFDLVTEQYYG